MFYNIDHSEFWVSEPLAKEKIRRAMLDRINTLDSRDPEASVVDLATTWVGSIKHGTLLKRKHSALRDDIKLYQALLGYINQAPQKTKKILSY